MTGLGKCSVSGCNREAGVIYPLLAGSPGFCPQHHNPAPDDFDPPIWEETLWEEFPVFREPILRRREFVWTDREGNDHKLKDIDDRYLANIINFLVRKNDDEFTRTIKFLMKEAKRRLEERKVAARG